MSAFFALSAARRDQALPRLPVGRAIARSYLADINRNVLRVMSEIIDQQLIALLPGLALRVRDSARADDLNADVSSIVDTMQLQLTESISDQALKNLATRRGTQVSELNARGVGRQLQRSIGLSVLAESEQLRSLTSLWSTTNAQLIRNLTNDHFTRVRSLVVQGLAGGQRHEVVARRIRESIGVPRRRAALIARDQIGSLNGQLTVARFQANGIQKFRWRTSGDERVRDEHQELEGKVFPITDPPPEGFPGTPINCRCTAEPVLN